MRRPEHHALYIKLIRNMLDRGYRIKGLMVDIGCRLVLHFARTHSHLDWLVNLPVVVGTWHVKVIALSVSIRHHDPIRRRTSATASSGTSASG